MESRRLDQSLQTVTVGITGHRWNKIAKSESSRIATQLASIFAAIDLAVRELQADAQCAQTPTLRLVSGLAEGADQLAVWSRPRGWVLDAILPFSRSRYLEDFAPANATGGIDQRAAFETALSQARSVVELADNDGDAVGGYERAGEMLLMESDLLVAVWDGEQAAGRGGTEAVVTRAVCIGMPVIWICSQHERMPKLISPLPEAGHAPEPIPATAEAIRRSVEPIVKALTAASQSPSVETR